MLRVVAALVLLVCCSMNNAHAAQKTMAHERIIAVLNNGDVQLEKTGKAVFQNTLAPEAPLLETWLAANALQQEITFTALADDRYGRTHITSNLHEQMLRDGVVLLYATQGDIPASWRLAEAAARLAKRGVWAKDSLLISPETALKNDSGFHVIEGTITRIYESKAGTYLNFGDDWRSDFSITLAPKLRLSMKAFLSSVKAGDTIRVRGSIVKENGPMIRLNHADNLEKNR